MDKETPEQQKCDETVGHRWKKVAYEPDTNSGGYLECRLCGFQVTDEDLDDPMDDV